MTITGIGSVSFGTDDDIADDVFSTTEGFTLTLEVKSLKSAALYLLTGSRRVFGWPRKLAVNGHEYNRRRRKH
jgi:hypothetical protein